MSIRKIGRSLGIYLMLVLLVISLSISGFGGLIEAPLAHALDSAGVGKWYDPYTILYTDGKNHHITFREQGKDVPGGDTQFIGDSVATYTKKNPNDEDFCALDPSFDWSTLQRLKNQGIATITVPNDGGSEYDVQIQGEKLAGGLSEDGKTFLTRDSIDITSHFAPYDNNPAATARVTNITGSDISGFSVSAGYRFGLGGACHGDRGDNFTFSNGRPALPKNVIGNVKWVGDYSMQVDGTITVQASDAIDYHPSDPPGTGTNGPLNETYIVTGRDFPEEPPGVSGNTMTFQSTVAVPASAPCQGLTTLLSIDPYRTYNYAQLHVGQSDGNGGCSFAHFWVKVENARPPLPVFDPVITGTWISANQIKINGAKLADQGVPEGTVFTGPKLIPPQGSMTLAAKAQCSGGGNNGQNTLYLTTFLLDPFATLTYWTPGTRRACQAQTIHIKLTNTNVNAQVSNLLEVGVSAVNSLEANLQNCPIDGNSGLNWLLCPLWVLGVSAVNALSGIIQNLLYVDTGTIFDPNSGFEAGFNTFRNIGMSLLIVAGLIMVVAQAAGLEIFSAHTIRKALPRIVIAAIGMALAWPLLEAVIIFFNDIGTWINSIILSVVPSGTAQAGVTTFNVWSGVVDILTAGTIVAVLGALGLFSLLITFLVGLLIGAIILIARQLVILVCVLLAPLAIASAVLPGTDVVWKTWRKTLLGALVMFPMIMGFLGAGAAMGQLASLQAQHIRAISNGATNGADLPWDVMAIGSVAVSLLALPSIFSMLTGFMGTIANGTQGLFKGFLENQKKLRAGVAAQNLQKLKAGSRYGKSWVDYVPGLGKFGVRGLTNFAGAQIGAGVRMRGRQAALTTNRFMTGDELAKVDRNYAANRGDPEFLNAMLGRPASAEGQAKARLVSKTRQNLTAVWDDVQKTGSFKGTHDDMVKAANRIGGLNQVARQTLRKNMEIASSGSRPDLAASTIQDGISGLKIGQFDNVKGAAYIPIFGDGTPASAAASPIVRMAIAGTAAQQEKAAALLYEASMKASADKQVFINAAITAVGGRGGVIFGEGKEAYARLQTGNP